MQQLQQNVLFEDHTYGRLQPLALSTPTYEIRCGMFNTRERLELVTSGQGGWALCREILRPLHTAPGWSCNANDPTERTLWLNGRLAPDADLVAKLHSLRAEDWALTDEQGLLAAALSPSLSALLWSS
ncbi:MAG: putative sugar nucleotidyl transferase, partial [Candidatus Krumholzibacteria bacterium]|nr:putative sugar nucleotidyl transferase [Candidatus Krumholzibacteria bacterium]